MASEWGEDVLICGGREVFDERAMRARLPEDVVGRFLASVRDGEATSESDQKTIAEAVFRWARELGATEFAHWFFPCRGGGGAVGGMCGALKYDALVDLDWTSKSANKPFLEALPFERLFGGESDGSSFPNGGLRVTHAAAAFTTWDRSSPCFVYNKVLRIPCSFVTHVGKCIDEKTPLLRSQDAVDREGKRLLKAVGCPVDTVHSYLGWEQEFFVISAELYKRRPDLVNCGRTLFGRLPARHQQGELNYFGPLPGSVDELLRRVQAIMLRVGSPMTVRHNEVAPAQHEMSPIFCVANASADSNMLFMEVCTTEAAKLGLVVLFHEKPFAGVNGSGKHANWSMQAGNFNFFHPGKTDEARTLFVAAIACLGYGMAEHNELVRCAVAHAGNDHRLGAQEAPPAIISLSPGAGFEQHIDKVIAGGPLLGYETKKKHASPGCAAAMPVETNLEDRNRTAPFPFCGNRFEFRAVGSSQNCSFPVMICNTIMAAGMSHLADLVDQGTQLRDAVALMFKKHRHVVFTGNGYSKDWPDEAAKRGLPNLSTTPLAIPHFATAKNNTLFKKLNIFDESETEARAEIMYEGYVTTLLAEVQTMTHMVNTGFLPACAKDLANFTAAPDLAGDRKTKYADIKTELATLQHLADKRPTDKLADEASYICTTLKPQMLKLRAAVDAAEGLLQVSCYPYPTYEQLLYSHHF